MILRMRPDEGVWSADGWANILALLMHRLEVEIARVHTGMEGYTVLWPALTISTFQTESPVGTDVLRVTATVEVREKD